MIKHESAELHSIKTLLHNYRGNPYYCSGMRNLYSKLVEDVNDIDLIELVRISPRKWQVCVIMTSDNSYNVEDDNLFLSPANFNISILNEQESIFQYNSLFGVREELICKWELDNFPDKFKIRDDSGKEYTQEELKEIYEKQQKRGSNE